jgi:cysteine desulfurase
LDCNVKNLGVDLMTLSSHKIYGPKGAGALYVSDKGLVTSNKGGNKHLSPVTCHLSPLLLGGGQEFGMRSGTENVPAIVGFAKAVDVSFSSSQEHWNEKIGDLRDHLWKGIKKIYPEAELNSLSLVTSHLSLPNILNVYFPNHDAQDLLTRFDLNGLAVSSGSACRSRAMESSYVIQALGYSLERAKSSVRFSLGRPTTKMEIDEALKIIKKVLR